jgi:putative hydrolase of HD superfamily
LTTILNNQTSEEIKSLWYEYESNISNEAQYVNALDRFLPIYANYLSKGFSWKKHGIKRSQVIDRNKNKIILGLPILWPIVEMIMNEAIEEKYLINDME